MRPQLYAVEVLETLQAIDVIVKKDFKFKAPINSVGYKGILLLNSVKGAAVLGFERGHGMAFKVLEALPDGTMKLSPPVLFKISKIAVGIQLGYNSVYSLLLLAEDKQLEALVRDTEAIIELDLYGYPGVGEDDMISVHKSSLRAVADPRHIHPAIIQATDSYMVCDISLYGGTLTVDREAMTELYGTSFTDPVQVFNGLLPPSDSIRPGLEEIHTLFNRVAAYTSE